MPSPANSTRRTPLLVALLASLLVVPTVLGYAAANAGESRPPTAAEDASGPPRTGVLSEQDQSELVSRAPLANAPTSAEDALTRQGEEALGIPASHSSPTTPDRSGLRTVAPWPSPRATRSG